MTVKGSGIIADKDLSIDARRNLSVLRAEESSTASSSKEAKKSGFTGGFSAGNLSAGYGKLSSSSQNSLQAVTQAASSVGSLNGSAKLKSGETLQVVASDIAAKENLTQIGKNVDLAAAQNTSVGQQTSQSKASSFSAGFTVNPLAAFKDAYKEDTKSTKNGSFVGREIGKAEGAADGARAAMTVATLQFGSHSKNSTENHASSEARTSTLTAGKDLTILATDGSITSQGTQMSAEGNALLLAKDSIKLDVAHTTETKSQNSGTSGFSFDNRSAMMVGTLHNKSNGNGATDTVTGTTLSAGGSATIATQTGDITLTGANVASEGQLAINAARNLTITSAQDTVRNANQSDNKAIGKVVISDTERFAGYHNEKHLDNGNEVKQVASNVGSLKGDVVLSAGEKYTQTSSNVTAGNDVSITAKTIDINTLDNTGSNQTANSDLKIGAFARISSPLIDLANNVEAARKSDGRLKEMQRMAAAANGVQAATSMKSGVLVKGEAGLGFASSSNSSNGNASTAEGSTISGGGNVNLTATGGDIHATGAALNAGKTLSLDAAQNIMLDASQSKVHSDGKNHSAGAEVGVGFQVGAQTGVYVYAAANVGNGHNNSDATVNNNTQLKADTINLHSKGDTTLKGATATANTINADVGGKLAVESLQDTSHQESSQTGVGVRVEFGFGVMNGSGSVSQAKSNGSSTSVGQQSGLFAGDGGYHVKADTIDLKGGAIASSNAAVSELTTNKLTTSNLENKMEYSASSVSMAGSISGDSDFGKKDAQGKTIPFTKDSQLFGDRKGGNVAPGLPMMEKGHDSSTTYATVTDGKITIGGVTTSSVKDLGISTDASKANVALDKLPDMQKLMKDQQAMSAAAGTVIATAKQVSAAFTSDARKAEEAAQKTLKNESSTPEQIAEANRTIEESRKVQAEWGVGGEKSRALNVVTGILVGGVAGQGGTQIAANAAAPYIASEIGDYFKTKGNENQTLQDLSHAVLGAALAFANNSSAAGGALAGGGGELAAQILTKELYPQAFDANGNLQRDKLTPEQANNVTALSNAIGALMSGAAGGTAFDAAIGGQVATNAVENNYLNHKRPDPMRLSEKERYESAVAACNSGDSNACKTRDELALASRKRDDVLLQACLTGNQVQCNYYGRQASAMGNLVSGSYGGVVYAISTDKGAIRDLNMSVIGPVQRPESFNDTVSKSTSEGLLLGLGSEVSALIPAKYGASARSYFESLGNAVFGEQRMARNALTGELRAGLLLADIPVEISIYDAKMVASAGAGAKVPATQSIAPALPPKPIAVPNYSASKTIETVASSANAKRVAPVEITYSFESNAISSGALDSNSLLTGITETAESNVGMGSARTALKDGPSIVAKEAQAAIGVRAVEPAAKPIVTVAQPEVSAGQFDLATVDDLAMVRLKYSVPDGNTIAVARTDIPGLEDAVLEGLSPTLRKNAGLPNLDELYGADRPIKSPYQNPLFTRHAEEDLFNGVTQRIEASRLSKADLVNKILDIKISNMSGVCNKCTAGLTGSSDLSGVLQQFSNRYPDLTIRITAEGGNAMPGRVTILVKGGKIVN